MNHKEKYNWLAFIATSLVILGEVVLAYVFDLEGSIFYWLCASAVALAILSRVVIGLLWEGDPTRFNPVYRPVWRKRDPTELKKTMIKS